MKKIFILKHKEKIKNKENKDRFEGDGKIEKDLI
jgi:hypothetical protein